MMLRRRYAVLTGKFGAGEATDPYLFSALRDICGAPLILCIASMTEMPPGRLLPRAPYRSELAGFFILGFFLFGNSKFFSLGSSV